MSLRKFNDSDIIKNTMRTHPRSEFLVFDGTVYYNNVPQQAGEFTSQALGVPPGHVSLYEVNIDRDGTNNQLIHPFITKQSSGAAFRTVSTTTWATGFEYGDVMSGSYPMSASITREYMETAGSRTSGVDKGTGLTFAAAPTYPHFFALKNRLDYYGFLSQHYKVSSSFGNKALQDVNLISIPSIFYGDKIDPGTVDLKWYLTGSLIGHLKDEKQNGELIQTGPYGSTGSGSVAGVVLYNEGFILLTGSWALNPTSIGLESDGGTAPPSWKYFGAGALDGVTQSSAGASYLSASFNLSFNGTNDVQVLTMFAHAKKGEVNYSNNPTFLKYNQSLTESVTSNIYEENADRQIYNTVSSSFPGHQAEFERQVYISRVAIYDENKNLLGIATLSDPVLKKEDEDLSFKIKLDI